jgi:hypothetical protein
MQTAAMAEADRGRGRRMSLEAVAKTGPGGRRQSFMSADGRELPRVCVPGPSGQPRGDERTLGGGGARAESHCIHAVVAVFSERVK